VARAERLLSSLQILRRHRRPVSGAALTAELDISLRTPYRDIGALQAQGAGIGGEAGIGYILRPGFMLPPLMFAEDEIEALVLGSRWVADRADPALAAAARKGLAKIAAVLPANLRDDLDASTLPVGPGEPLAAGDSELPTIRRAIKSERKLAIVYRGPHGIETWRMIWPFALGFFDRARVVAALCELRQAFRHFRTDRITALQATETRYPRRRQVLLKEWREIEAIAPQ
jgi:predicted DNA-binding transcriptional regulator YafY